MPRYPRIESPTGIYHVIVRGINKQRIFEDDSDNRRMLRIISECKPRQDTAIFAYCLMGNHMHLLMRVDEVSIGRVMRIIGTKYVLGFNLKYGRIGGLFQDRFRSEPVLSFDQFAATMRYIHMNPVYAGLCKTPGEYCFSSYSEYFDDPGVIHDVPEVKIADKELTYKIVPKHRFAEAIEFHKQEEFDIAEYEIQRSWRRMSDEAAAKLLNSISGCENTTEFQRLDVEARDRFLKEMLTEGAPVNQIVRITGVSRGVIYRVRK